MQSGHVLSAKEERYCSSTFIVQKRITTTQTNSQHFHSRFWNNHPHMWLKAKGMYKQEAWYESVVKRDKKWVDLKCSGKLNIQYDIKPI